ncbi:MAG TPA: hypothetical protein VG406_18425 [Isosphaeraceae bacterium]|jgi:hypothetical protein|nr:hypothetical protein [Isosphaeraceae bacterium]
MADKIYKITFEGDNANLLRSIQANVQALQAMDDRAKAAGRAVGDIGAAGDKAAGGLGHAAEETGHLGSGLDGLLGKAAVFGALTTVAREFGSAIAEARESLVGSAEDAAKLRDALREVAALKGRGGPDDVATADFAAFRVATGLKEAEARKFQEQFEGTLPAGLGRGNITRDVAEKLAEEGGRWATRTGLDGATAGDLTAMLPQYSKVPSVEVGASQLGQIGFALNEGRGNLSPLAKSLANTAGSLVDEEGGPVKSLPELAAILGVASQNANPAAAGTRVQQAFRALNRFDGDRGQTLQGLGIGGDDDLLARLQKVAPMVRDANRPGRGGAAKALWEAGFHNQAENRSLIQLVNNLDAIERRVARVRALDSPQKVAADGQRVMALDADFLRREKAGQRRVGEAVQDAGQLVRGRGGEVLQALRQAAEGRLKARGAIDTTATNLTDSINAGFGVGTLLGGRPQREERIDREVRRMLEEQGRSVGVDAGKVLDRHRAFAVPFPQLSTPEDTRRRGVEAAAEAIRAKGGDPIGSAEVLKELRAIRDAVADGNRARGEPPRHFLPPAPGPVKQGR